MGERTGKRGLPTGAFAFILLGALVFGATAGAEAVGPIDVDGDLVGPNDWGGPASVGSGNHPASVWEPQRGAWVAEDSVTTFDGYSGYVGPGYGGQDFDIEALYSGFDLATNTIYVAIVTGFTLDGYDPFGVPDSFLNDGAYTNAGDRVYAGDVFIDFGWGDTSAAGNDPTNPAYAAHTWDLAFRIGQDGGNWNATALTVGGTIGTPSPNAPEYGYNGGPFQATGGTTLGPVDFAYGLNGAGTDHHVYEFGFQLDPTRDALWIDQLVGGNGYGVHWTMSCGNDVLDLHVAPVPAPLPGAAALGALGSLTLAARGFLRRKRASIK